MRWTINIYDGSCTVISYEKEKSIDELYSNIIKAFTRFDDDFDINVGNVKVTRLNHANFRFLTDGIMKYPMTKIATDITNLNGIEKFPQLVSLQLECKTVTEAEIELNNFVDIEILYITRFDIIDFSFLKYFPKLNRLYIEKDSRKLYKLSNLTNINLLTKLTDLHIYNCHSSALILDNLKKLKLIRIRGEIEYIEVADDNKITEIDISDNYKLKDVDFLVRCKNLIYLSLTAVDIKSFESIKFSTKLKKLLIRVNKNPVNINHLPKSIVTLRLHNNNSKNIFEVFEKNEQIKFCTKDKDIKINKFVSDEIINIESLKEFNNLKVLDLTNKHGYYDKSCDCNICYKRGVAYSSDYVNVVCESFLREINNLSFLNKDIKTIRIDNMHIEDFGIIFTHNIRIRFITYNKFIIIFKYLKMHFAAKELTQHVADNSELIINNQTFRDICLNYSIDYETGRIKDIRLIECFYRDMRKATKIKKIKIKHLVLYFE